MEWEYVRVKYSYTECAVRFRDNPMHASQEPWAGEQLYLATDRDLKSKAQEHLRKNSVGYCYLAPIDTSGVCVSLLTIRMMTRTSACDWIRAGVHQGAAAIRSVYFLELLVRLRIRSN